MPAGRPRKPVEAKILEGTFRPDRDGGSAPVSGTPKPPPYLEGEALTHWSALVPGMIARGVVGETDSSQLGLMCFLHGEIVHFIGVIKRSRGRMPIGDRLIIGKKAEADDKVSTNTYVQLGICIDKYDRIAAKFGLTPSDRAKLRLDVTVRPASRVASRKRN